MPEFLLSLCICLCSITGTKWIPSPPTYIKTKDGVIIYPKEDLCGNTKAVRIQIIRDNIIRIIASPSRELSPRPSLIAIADTSILPKWDLIPSDSSIRVKTKSLSVVADMITGRVSFYDQKGKEVIREKKSGRKIEPEVYEGERSYQITQSFETTDDDAYYGLGQHQQGLLNYKGYQVTLFQNNTEVAVPFLVSRKNYGILWDNYSLTKVGDVRPYKSLSDLKLYSPNGEKGWLTASYSNDRDHPGNIFLKRTESDIEYEYVNDSKLHLPREFDASTGIVTWEGYVASALQGEHRLKFTYAGYMKVWLDGRLVLDRWRQSWNPCSVILNYNFEKDKKYPIKIEWIPDGSESYASFHWLGPLDQDQKNGFSFCSDAGKQLDYYFVLGNNMDEVISGYRTLTGKAVMVPQWALGFWQSRERYKTQEEILKTVEEFRKRKIPLDNIVLDWSYWKQDDWGSQEFDTTRFPDAENMIRLLHEKYHTHFMISVWPKFYEGIENYNLFDKNGWLYKRNIVDRQRDWIGQGYVSTFYDAFNKDARRGFWELIDRKLYKKGIDAWWMDASEPDIFSNVSVQKRKELMYPLAAGLTSEYLNAYPLENARGIYEGQRTEYPANRVFILTRSGFAGLQRYASAVWSGDIAARWHDMKTQIAAGVNFSMSGIPYWTMDIGGFAVEKRFENPTDENLKEWRELMTRWYQFGSFVPLFRVHGQYPYREIFNVSSESDSSYQSMLYYDKLRYRLMPYIYSLAGLTYHKDYTMMRGLVMDFPLDDAVINLNDQFMFGPSLLISPVCGYKERSRKVYLPKGQGWYDLYSGKYYQGGNIISANAPYDRIPVFVKEGSVIPFGPELQYSGEKPADTVSLFIYGGRNCSFSLYEDEGSNYNYEKGLCSTIPIVYNETTRTLSIGERKGSFPGMLVKRFFKIYWIRPGTARTFRLDEKSDKVVSYTGKVVTIKM